MLPAPIPHDEPDRIASLRRMLLLASPDEEAFDRVTRTAQRLFDVPITLVSLIDANRQWFKSCIGLPVRETGRDVSFCGHAIMAREIFVVEDANVDSRFADNPLVAGDPKVIFYAGRPLVNPEGFVVGTLCIIDHEPRHFSGEDRRALDDLGYWLELIFSNRQMSEVQQKLLGEVDEIRRNSMLDPMLNIWSREAGETLLQNESLRAYHNHSALSLFAIRIDRLDEITAKYGPATRDSVQIEFAKCLRSMTRAYDSLGRHGDEDFMVILPDTDSKTALELALRLKKTLSFLPFVAGEDFIDVTVSIGIAAADYREQTPEPGMLLLWAEAAMQRAAELGGDRVECQADGAEAATIRS
jgi:diguanylate cyclase (GGDEF)-like protein